MASDEKALSAKLSQQTGVQTVSSFKHELQAWWKANSKRVEQTIGGAKKAVRLYSGLNTAIERNPAILGCTRDSLFNCILQSAVTGLVPGAYQECAYLPFRNGKTGKLEAVFCPMYHGLVRLLYESGYVQRIDSKVVYENDAFEYEEGLHVKLMFKPLLVTRDRGEPMGAYCLIINKFGEPLIKFSTREEIEEIRDRSPSARAADSPWNAKERVKWESMWMKTALKQNIKLIPKTKELLEALDRDDEAEGLSPKRATVNFMEDKLHAVEAEVVENPQNGEGGVSFSDGEDEKN